MGAISFANIGVPIILLVITFFIVKYRKRKMAGTGATTFHLKRNFSLAVIEVNSLLCFASAVTLADYLLNNTNVPVPIFSSSGNSDALKAAVGILVIETIVTCFLCAINYNWTAPWDAAWEEHVALSRHKVIALQIWFCVSLFGTWIARTILLQTVVQFQNNNKSNSLPPHVWISIFICCVTAVLQLVFIMTWCCWWTFWNRTRYEEFRCPACHGDPRMKSTCTFCSQNGMTFHHP